MSYLPQPLDQAVKDELENGEELKWAEQSIPFREMISGLSAWIFALPWTLFFFYWLKSVPMENEGFIFIILGILCFSGGVYMMLHPIRRYKSAQNTVYAITNRRAFCLELTSKVKIKSYTPKEIHDPKVKVKQDGSGDLILRVRHYKDSDGDQKTDKYGFNHFNNAKGAGLAIIDLMSEHGYRLVSEDSVFS